MKENVGSMDRGARAVIGPAMLALGVRSLLRASRRKRVVAPLAAVIAGTMLTETAITRVCPLNALLGVDTRRRRARVSVDEEGPRTSPHHRAIAEALAGARELREGSAGITKKKGEVSIREAAELEGEAPPHRPPAP